ncbi:MAG: hypothetical protein IKW49_00855 [Opitutales bacterium]|nr:hypothetical protein [Opitutales bacterium]
MIVAYKFGAWRVSFLRDCEAAKKLFEAFVDSRLPRESVTLLADGLTGKVWKIEFCGRTYVLKHDLRKRHRFEFLVQSFFCGSNATRLLRKLDGAADGESGEHPAVRVFLAADKIRYRCVLESFVLMEFVRGKGVNLMRDGKSVYGKACADAIRWLHARDLVHGDVHPGNFIVEDGSGRVRVIDISGKRATAYQRGFDKFRVGREFGVRLDAKPGFWERLARAHSLYRERKKAKKAKKQSDSAEPL